MTLLTHRTKGLKLGTTNKSLQNCAREVVEYWLTAVFEQVLFKYGGQVA